MSRNSKTPHLFALILGLGFFALIGAFVAMAMISRDEVPLNPVGPLGAAPGVELGGVRFSGTVHVWDVLGSIGRDQARTTRVELSLRGPNSQPPDGSLRLVASVLRPDSSSSALALPLQRSGRGLYHGQLALPDDGPWQFRLNLPDAEITGILNFSFEP